MIEVQTYPGTCASCRADGPVVLMHFGGRNVNRFCLPCVGALLQQCAGSGPLIQGAALGWANWQN